jgi:biuret amidohydrolase
MSAVDLEKTDYVTAYMNHPEPDFSKAALLVIDMQYATGSREGTLYRRLAKEGKDVAELRFNRIYDFVVPNAKRLLDAFRANDGTIVFLKVGAQKPDASDAPRHMRGFFTGLENYAGSRQNEIIDELKPLPNEHVVNKTTMGAFASSNIDSVLRALRAEQLYCTGVSTNMCVDTTAREAADRGYAVTLIEDACGSARPEYHEAAIVTFQRLFGRVTSTDGVLEELGLS